MYAIEFEADLEGNILHVPDRFKELTNKHVRVVMMTESVEKPIVRSGFGIAKGQVKSKPGFEEPLNEDELKEFGIQ